ncbi:hypothetical protein [Pseudomonas sp. MWU13-3659]|uniref:hypothetical protein n=1 Tax=Pseudomonas sp. MWU13-3659 TaxID=2986964 RepID=UPI0020755664|nr:hypothetical protein [Pseudomonas sp. MWU13-3659]
MNYNAAFVDELLGNFHASFLKNEHKWCDFARVNPEGDAYRKWVYQKLYTLRYFPAYYLEYCVLAEKLKARLGQYDECLQVASFGCGICPDYYALRDNLGEIEFEYTGYDSCRWSMRKLVPKDNSDNLSFCHLNIGALDSVDLDDVDVFIFPKSIGDIARSGGLERLARLIARTEKKRVFFLNSFISSGRNEKSIDLSCFDGVHEALIKSGFGTEDDRSKTSYEGGAFDVGLVRVSSDFNYPERLMINCEREGSSLLCEGCNVIKRPVMRNRFMEYQLLEYTRP